MQKKKLNPKEIQHKIRELQRAANENFHKAGTYRKKSLICALHCGEALNEIKGYIKHGEWQQWLDKNFEGSYETAAVYMGIAKHWGDTRIAKMREEGITIDSIKGFYDTLRGKTDTDFVTTDKEEKSKIDRRYCFVVDELVKEFRAEVKALDRFKPFSHRYKLFILSDDFYYFWSKIYVELKKLAKERERAEGKTS